MNAIVEQALALWEFAGASWSLVAARENQVFRVDHADRTYALRLRRPGYRTEAELRSELMWMAALDRGGLHVPRPVPSASGALLHMVGAHAVDVLTWLPGAPVGKTGVALQVKDSITLFRNIGREMARLHEVSDSWSRPEGFTRQSWDRAGLVGETPVWDRFWDNPTLSDADRLLFMRLRDTARDRLAQIGDKLDFGLIHADLVRENIMVDGDRLQLIDFDDGGFGYRLFDIATTLIRNQNEPNYDGLKAALIEGYLSVRDLDLAALDLFIVLRAATYVGWIITRMNEDGSGARNTRFVTHARALARAYLSEKGATR
ncbi:homoserine kinase [Sulfitobacter sp. G21635-S1]|uniref:phosphotransferase enzyme family protein n=1 Tax=Sulfitobacter sp. G21635-S1 TaxID=3014043 RepID=UPI0022AEF62B|nr:homoserine kinase [Sulfitobacter sp. G21635-S1]MCZ4254054.1 homoserine kinase [Sulfitobacter sp. G21635-S1]